MMSVRRLGLLGLVMLTGCAPASEVASLRLFVDETGAFVGVYGGSSATGVEVEVEWSMELSNRGAQACPVAVYRWVDALPEGELPSVEPWPETWDGGERVADGVVEPGASLALGPATLGEGEEVEVLLGLAACPGGDLEVDVRAEVVAELGVRSISEALVIQLWRAD